MTSPNQPPKSRRGFATLERYGTQLIAERAREGIIAKYLREDGLDPSKMTPENLAAYRAQVPIRHAAKARAAKALQDAASRAEREAMAEVEEAQRQTQKAIRRAERKAATAERRAAAAEAKAEAARQHLATVRDGGAA